MSRKSFFIETFGCQMNVNDSEKVAGLLTAQGYEPAASAAEASFVFINTCAVREKAADKLYHALDRLKGLKRRHPDLVIGVGGCVAQLQGRGVLERAPHVDVLVGTHNIAQVPQLVERARGGFQDCVALDRKADAFSVPSDQIAHRSPVRAYVTAIEGCNHVCSFCVVPRTRGPEVCRPLSDIVAEVQNLVARGYPEVMLLGQTVNAYLWQGHDFADLLRHVSEVPGLLRLRFTTSHPSEVSPRMADALRDLPNVCPYLHLPVQSGSDPILESMRRGYTRQQYLDTVALLRDRVPGLALTSDIIVGYPGESEHDFEETLDLVQAVGFEGLFTFTYSPRPGTTAVRLTDDVPEDVKRHRLHVLNNNQQRRQALRHATLVGTIQDVLVDTLAAEGRVAGRTPHFKIVHFDGPEAWLGRVLPVQIDSAGPNSLVGHAARS